MSCSAKSWQYGVQGGSGPFGGYIKVRLPPSLPTLKCLYGIFVSLSTPSAFYQTFLGFKVDAGWHASGGSTNPALPCDLHCPPYVENGVQYVPKPGATLELGVRLDGTNAVAYFIDDRYHEVFKLPEAGQQQGAIGCVLESYDIDPGDLQHVGPFEVLACAQYSAPGLSGGWPHASVYGPTSRMQGYEDVPHVVNILPVGREHFFIGYGFETPASLW